MSYKKVQTDISKSYMNAAQALEDEGFKSIGTVYFKKVSEGSVSREAFEKDGKKYYFVGMNHFNSTIYHVNLRSLEALADYTLIND